MTQPSTPFGIIPPGDIAALDLVVSRFESPQWKEMEQHEELAEQLPQVEMPLQHIFTHGLYMRQITMPAGTLITTRIHMREHPFVVLTGVFSVWDIENGWVLIRAPHKGVTKAGTRRVLYIHEETVFLTFHVSDKTDPDEVIREVTYSAGKYAALRGAAAIPQLEHKS